MCNCQKNQSSPVSITVIPPVVWQLNSTQEYYTPEIVNPLTYECARCPFDWKCKCECDHYKQHYNWCIS